MQINGDPITECPICRYSLEGLPRDHQCPECGFEYDETMRVWRTKLSLAFAVVPVLIFAAFFLLVAIQLWQSGRLGYLRTNAVPWLCLFFPIVANLANYFLLREFIVVGKSGLTFKVGYRKPLFRPWKDVQLKYPFMPTDPTDLGPTLPRYLPTRLMTKAERRELRDEIVRRLENYQSSVTDAP